MVQRFDAVVAAFAKARDVALEPGWSTGNFTLKVGGKIFAMTTAAGFVAKLPRTRVDELVAARAGTRFDPRKNGRVMKEWLVARADTDWIGLAREAYAFVGAVGAVGAVGPAKRRPARPRPRKTKPSRRSR